MCHQSVGLVARHAEGAGIPTLCLSSALDITRAVNPPRAAFLDFPLGHTAGPPGDAAAQRDIVLAALRGFDEIAGPGGIVRLPFRWPGGEAWKETTFAEGDERQTRHDAPQYQTEEDRRLAECGGGLRIGDVPDF